MTDKDPVEVVLDWHCGKYSASAMDMAIVHSLFTALESAGYRIVSLEPSKEMVMVGAIRMKSLCKFDAPAHIKTTEKLMDWVSREYARAALAAAPTWGNQGSEDEKTWEDEHGWDEHG